MNAQPKSSTPRVDAKVIKTAGGDIVYADDARTLERENAELRAALEEITKGEGPFNRDQLTFAGNTIEAMKAIARVALGAT